MNKLVVFVTGMLLSAFVFSEHQYDPYNDEWITVLPDTEYENKYNSHTDEWSLEAEESEIEYNPYTDEWDYQK